MGLFPGGGGGGGGGERRTRKWEVFPGRNRFWCGGRGMTAPRPAVLGATLALICGTAALHFALDCPFLARAVSPAVPAGGAALTALVLAALLRTALSDPGVLPRAPPHEAPPGPGTSDAGRPPPRARELLVRGRLVKLKYCFTCKVFRPPRASHCSLCDNCVERFDHHCPWVGNCVGRRNYRHFYVFVVSLALLCVWVLGCALAHLALAARAHGLAAALRREPGSALAAAVCFLSVWSVLGLAGFHTYLVATDQTTNEDIKGSWAGGANPYSRGSACANCWSVLCAPTPPSLIDRRGFVSSEEEELPPLFRAALAAPHVVTVAPALSPAPSPAPALPAPARHAYMNHSLDLDSLPLQEVVVCGGGGGGGAREGAGGAGAGEVREEGGALPLSASRLQLLLHTTMIDAALDLDDPTAPASPPATTTVATAHST